MTQPLMLYLKPHHAHRAMGEAVGAEFVELDRGNPLDRVRAARALDVGDRPVITEGGKPLFQAVWMKFFGNCGPIIHLAADETLPNVFEKYPHYAHHERVVHFLEHQFVDGVIGISDDICDAARRLGIDNVVKTYPFTEPWKYELLSGVSPDFGSDRLLVVAHGSAKNNLDALEDIARECEHDVSIDVIGNRTERLDSEHVTGHGFVAEEERFADFFARAELFCFPAISQMFGVVVLEAMHAGLPPVITEDVGAKEILDERFVAATSNSALAERIDWYLDLPGEEKRALSASLRADAEPYAPEAGVERFENAYQEVINGIQ